MSAVVATAGPVNQVWVAAVVVVDLLFVQVGGFAVAADLVGLVALLAAVEVAVADFAEKTVVAVDLAEAAVGLVALVLVLAEERS